MKIGTNNGLIRKANYNHRLSANKISLNFRLGDESRYWALGSRHKGE